MRSARLALARRLRGLAAEYSTYAAAIDTIVADFPATSKKRLGAARYHKAADDLFTAARFLEGGTQ